MSHPSRENPLASGIHLHLAAALTLAQVVVRGWIKAVAADDLSVAARGHDNLVDTKSAPVLDRLV